MGYFILGFGIGVGLCILVDSMGINCVIEK